MRLAHGDHGGTEWEGQSKPVALDAAEESVADGEVMLQENFGAAGDFDVMMVEAAWLQGEAESNLVQVQTIAPGTVELSADSAIPQDPEVERDEDDQGARYQLPLFDKEGFRASDLVWSKVQGHPWWPGEIFDPSHASDLALKHQKKGNHLVAFFGDNTFAWCDESQLKPFMANYSQMEKQSKSDAFTISVNHSLQELSRRILSGTSCSCLPEEFCDNGMSYMIENSGLKDGVTCSTVSQDETLKYFSPQSLLRYVKSLALSPGQGGDLLDLVIACSQLMSFNRSKGCFGIASFQTESAWVENGMDNLSTKNVMLGENLTNKVQPTHFKPKRGKGRSRKRKPENNFELTEKRPIVKPQNGRKFHNNTGEAECSEFDISSGVVVNELSVKKWAKRRRVQRNHHVDSKDLLTNVCSAAIEPMNECSFSGMAISYFSDYRNCAVSASTEVSIIGEVDGKRSGMQKTLPSPNEETTDHMQDAYWSGLSLHNGLIHSVRGESGSKRPICRQRSSRGTSVPSSDLSSFAKYLQPGALGPNKKIQVIERPIIHVDEKMHHEIKPTALVLSFGWSTALPSERDLIRFFSRYGPLKQTETEVHKNTNTAKVVFKKCVDAERAFTVTGNFNSFGPSLSSFRLVTMPFLLDMTETNSPKLRPEDSGLEVLAPRVYKGEAIKGTSFEQADMVKQAGQHEVTNEESLDDLSDTIQIEIVGKVPKHSLACVDCVVEASKDTMEVDNRDEAREEASMPQELQA